MQELRGNCGEAADPDVTGRFIAPRIRQHHENGRE